MRATCISFIIVSCIFYVDAWIHRWKASRGTNSRLKALPFSDDDYEAIYKEEVDYVLMNAPISEPSLTARPLPLFLLDYPFFPQGVTGLQVFEMKYRTMMFDIAKEDDCFGYIHLHPETGQVAKYGTIAKVVERELQEDGRQMILVLGIGRFQVNNIIKSVPYVLAEVEPDIQDYLLTSEQEAKADLLEKEIFKSYKFIARMFQVMSPDGNYGLSVAIYRNRPTADLITTTENNAARRSNFSFALVDMLRINSAVEAQKLLQCRDVIKRLQAIKHIVVNAADNIHDTLLQSGKVEKDILQSLRAQSFNTEYIDDITPVINDEFGKPKEQESVMD